MLYHVIIIIDLRVDPDFLSHLVARTTREIIIDVIIAIIIIVDIIIITIIMIINVTHTLHCEKFHNTSGRSSRFRCSSTWDGARGFQFVVCTDELDIAGICNMFYCSYTKNTESVQFSSLGALTLCHISSSRLRARCNKPAFRYYSFHSSLCTKWVPEEEVRRANPTNHADALASTRPLFY